MSSGAGASLVTTASQKKSSNKKKMKSAQSSASMNEQMTAFAAEFGAAFVNETGVDFCEDGTVVLATSGGLGQAKKTVEGRNAAMAMFSRFLFITRRKTSLDELTQEEACSNGLLDEFKSFLVKSATNVPGSPMLIALGTATQYLSGAFNVIKAKYPNDPNYINEKMPWYTKLRRELIKQISVVCMKEVRFNFYPLSQITSKGNSCNLATNCRPL
jgi:hypothetical protein